jgi:DeoR family suf operon transcriptional repressor
MTTSGTEPTKERIFQALRAHGQMTVSDLAAEVKITPIAVRHHLNILQAEGMVEVREERHGVGRPRQIYKLTSSALERDTTRYFQFTALLLDQLKAHLPPETVDKLLLDVASGMAEAWKEELDGLPLPRRLERFVELLTEEGFVARIESTGAGQYCLTELVCPYSRISVSHPEVCSLDASMISRALGTPVERTSWIRSGAETCTYSITATDKDPRDE